MNNFHTHTKRCNHAVGNEEEYVIKAIEAGYSRLGFSDHMPLPPKDNEWSYRMSPFEVDDYVAEVLRLKEKYQDQIDILLSFEFEYFNDRVEWVDHLIDKYPLDYTIAGNHFYNEVADGSFYGKFGQDKILEKYYETAKFLLESEKFDIFAHPDLFMNSYPKWDNKTKELSEVICRLASKHDIILEYNLAGLKNEKGYPNNKFWEIAIENNNKIIIGVDAHSPHDFSLNLHKQAIKDLKAQGANLILDIKERV